MTVSELIDKLKDYPKDMRVASLGLPHDDLEIRIVHYESDNPKMEEFDFVAIE